MNQASGMEDKTSTAGRVLQVKVCGLTRVEEALACVALGVDAIGCVFYPPSPRFVTDRVARDIAQALPGSVCTVGVFVDASFSTIMKKVEQCGLRGVQLHGQEPAELVRDLLREGLFVIKGLYVEGEPSVVMAPHFDASAYLVECRKGILPGGNAMAWDWGSAAGTLPPGKPMILAGGLTPETVGLAIASASPDAVDVSSGVESSPGHKDIDKVKCFLEGVRNSIPSRIPRRIFR